MNHIGFKLSSDYKIFADDSKIYACANPSASVARPGAAPSIPADINALHCTSESWGLTLNWKKVLCCASPVILESRFLQSTYWMAVLYRSVRLMAILACWLMIRLNFMIMYLLLHIGKAYGLCQSFLKPTECWTPEFMMFLLRTHARPLIEYASCVWNTGYKEDLRKLEHVQQMWTRQIKRLEGMPYGERLSELSLFSLQDRPLRSDLIPYWKVFLVLH